MEGMKLQEKEEEKDGKAMGKPFRKTIWGQRIPEPSCVRTEPVKINILTICSNGDRKIMQPIRISSASSDEHLQNQIIPIKKTLARFFKTSI